MGTSDVQLAMARVVRTLDEFGIPYAICGAMAVNAHGLQRATEDVDILLTPEGLVRFKSCAFDRGFVEYFPGSRGVRDAAHGVPINFLLTGGSPGDGVLRGLTFPDPTAVAIERAGAKYVGLATLLEMRIGSGMSAPDRPRDFDDVIRLVRQNELGAQFADSLHRCVREKYRELWHYAQLPPRQRE